MWVVEARDRSRPGVRQESWIREVAGTEALTRVLRPLSLVWMSVAGITATSRLAPGRVALSWVMAALGTGTARVQPSRERVAARPYSSRME